MHEKIRTAPKADDTYRIGGRVLHDVCREEMCGLMPGRNWLRPNMRKDKRGIVRAWPRPMWGGWTDMLMTSCKSCSDRLHPVRGPMRDTISCNAWMNIISTRFQPTRSMWGAAISL